MVGPYFQFSFDIWHPLSPTAPLPITGVVRTGIYMHVVRTTRSLSCCCPSSADPILLFSLDPIPIPAFQDRQGARSLLRQIASFLAGHQGRFQSLIFLCLLPSYIVSKRHRRHRILESLRIGAKRALMSFFHLSWVQRKCRFAETWMQ